VTLKSPHLQQALDATSENVAEVIALLPQQKEGDRFAILAKHSQTYVQTLSTADGFQLEYQDGSIAEHYHCTREDLSAAEVIEVSRDYLADDIFWKRRFPFECRDLRTPSFRAGFWFGHFLGKIADVLGLRKV
jgi:hypothetical protein